MSSKACGARLIFFPVGETISLVSVRDPLCCMYVPPKCRHIFGLSCTSSAYRYHFFFAFEHNTQHRQQTNQYSSRAESVVNPRCIQHYNPAVQQQQQQQQHSGQPRAHEARLHAVVLLWLSVSFLSRDRSSRNNTPLSLTLCAIVR